MGIRRLWQARRADADRPRVATESVAAIALLTLSNGADNISLYIPFFVIGRPNLLLILVVYAALVALWCLVGRWLGEHLFMLRAVDRWGHWVVPTVFVGLGIYALTS
jgi:cadmium resistance protein CadD (predicted permease)